MGDDCGHDHSDLDRQLEKYVASWSAEQKQAYLMLSGMLTLLSVLDRKEEGNTTFLTRSEITDVVNSSAEKYGIVDAILITARSFDMPL